MNIDEPWKKYATWTEGMGEWIHKENFTQAIAEIISHPLGAEVKPVSGGKEEIILSINPDDNNFNNHSTKCRCLECSENNKTALTTTIGLIAWLIFEMCLRCV